MSKSPVQLQPACVLHRRAYRETSQLIDAFTLDYGRQSLVARGIRKQRSKWGGLLEPFQPLLLSWVGRGELVTLTGVELEVSSPIPSAEWLRSAFYLNELVLRLLAKNDPHPEFFRQYWQSLESLRAGANEAVVLRTFERELLSNLGYGLVTDHEVDTGELIDPSREYYYALDTGPTRLATTGCPVHGRTLIAIGTGEFPDDNQLMAEAKRLMRHVLSAHLGSRPLGSRMLFGDPL